MIRNYQRELDMLIEKLQERGERPRLLLHSCCAPCSSYVLAYLAPVFRITLFYDNPNIRPAAEYDRRLAELERLVECMALPDVTLRVGSYDTEVFDAIAKGRETDREGGSRCYDCYRMRLERAAKEAAKGEYPYFATTLSISPHKNAAWINEIGEELAERYGILFLPEDFKKKEGYKQSLLLSQKYDLYRQRYCGCCPVE